MVNSSYFTIVQHDNCPYCLCIKGLTVPRFINLYLSYQCLPSKYYDSSNKWETFDSDRRSTITTQKLMSFTKL